MREMKRSTAWADVAADALDGLACVVAERVVEADPVAGLIRAACSLDV